MTQAQQLLQWQEQDKSLTAEWQSANHAPAPKKLIVADDTLTADHAYRLACEGTGIVWRGDFQNAKQLVQAIARRLEKTRQKGATKKSPPTQDTKSTSLAFHEHRRDQVQKSRILGMVLIPVTAELTISLRRAPDVKEALEQALSSDLLQKIATTENGLLISLKELLGIIGAYQWRKNGVRIDVLGDTIHPYYSVYSPIRGEYLNLIAKVPLPTTELAFDIGTGTGVIAAVLAKRGVKKIIATDLSEVALACARENIDRLQMSDQIELRQQDLFPEGRAPLIVCNPPWLPAKPSSTIEYALYDPNSEMLKAFLSGLTMHLEPNGEAWLIMSDLAEHLGLRSHNELWDWIQNARLKVIGKMDIRPSHAKSQDRDDPLHEARSKEVTSLWRLRMA